MLLSEHFIVIKQENNLLDTKTQLTITNFILSRLTVNLTQNNIDAAVNLESINFLSLLSFSEWESVDG